MSTSGTAAGQRERLPKMRLNYLCKHVEVAQLAQEHRPNKIAKPTQAKFDLALHGVSEVRISISNNDNIRGITTDSMKCTFN